MALMRKKAPDKTTYTFNGKELTEEDLKSMPFWWQAQIKEEKPTYEGYDPIRDDETGLINSPWLNADANKYVDPSSMQMLEQQARSTGPSPWAGIMDQKSRMEQNQKMAEMSGQLNGAQAAARSGMAMRGGMDSGARERSARDVVRQTMLGGNDIRRQGELSRMEIGAQDADKKQNLLAQMPGMENSRAGLMLGADQFNIGNALQQKTAEELAKVNEYNEKMKGWAAGKQADATANAGK